MVTNLRKPTDAVAAIIYLDDFRYLLQLRDCTPSIWYPNAWGCFGGGVEEDEDPKVALRRELYEELELSIENPKYFTRFDFDFSPLGFGSCYRTFYTVQIDSACLEHLALHEGQSFEAHDYEFIKNNANVTPFDRLAIDLHWRTLNLLCSAT